MAAKSELNLSTKIDDDVPLWERTCGHFGWTEDEFSGQFVKGTRYCRV